VGTEEVEDLITMEAMGRDMEDMGVPIQVMAVTMVATMVDMMPALMPLDTMG